MLRASPFVLAVVLLAATSAPVAVLGGCDDARCERSESDPKNPERGRMADDDTWESSGIDDEWLDFSHQRTIYFDPGRRVFSLMAWVSPDPRPSDTRIFSVAAGNLAVFHVNGDKVHFNVRNDTCANYFVRVVAEVEPLPPPPPPPPAVDAGVDAADAASPDAADAAAD